MDWLPFSLFFRWLTDDEVYKYDCFVPIECSRRRAEVNRGQKVKGSWIPSWTVISLCKLSVILINIVTHCAILSNIGLFPAHQSTEEKSLSNSSLISSSTSSTWHTGCYLSPIGLKWRRTGKGPLLRSSTLLWLPSRTKSWKSICGPKHVANSRRPGVLTSRSTSLNLLLVTGPSANPSKVATPPGSPYGAVGGVADWEHQMALHKNQCPLLCWC